MGGLFRLASAVSQGSPQQLFRLTSNAEQRRRFQELIAQNDVAQALDVVREEELKALCLQTLERWDEALKRWDVARDVLPGSEAQECRLHMGYCEARQGQWETAGETLDVEDRAGESFYCRAVVLAALGRADEARESMQRFVAFAPRRLGVLPPTVEQAAAQFADLHAWVRAVLLRRATEMGQEINPASQRFRSHCEVDFSLANPLLRGMLLRAPGLGATAIGTATGMIWLSQGDKRLEEQAMDAATAEAVAQALPLYGGEVVTATHRFKTTLHDGILTLHA